MMHAHKTFESVKMGTQITCIALMLTCSVDGLADEQPVTVAHVCECFKKMDNEVTSLSFVEWSYDENDSSTYSHRICHVMAPDRFFQDFAHGGKAMDWQEDPFRKVNFLKREQTAVYFPFTRRFHTSTDAIPQGEELPMVVLGTYLMDSGLWLPRYWKGPKWMEAPISLGEIARDEKTLLELESDTEIVNGVVCHVLKYGDHQRLYVDSRRGCCLIARQYTSGEVGYSKRIDLFDHQEVIPGVWLPTRIHRSLIARKDGAVSRKDGHTRIEDLQVNKTSEDQFDLALPAGAYRESPIDQKNPDEDNKVEGDWGQCVPGGEDLLVDLGTWLRKHAVGIPKGKHDVWRVHPDVYRFLIGVALFEVIWWTLFGRTARPRASEHCFQTHVCLLLLLTGSLSVGCSPRDNISRGNSSFAGGAESHVPPEVENAAGDRSDNAERASHDDLALMQGEWQFAQFLIGGDLLVETSGQIVRIDGNTLHLPKSRKRPEKNLTFALDSQKTPKQIDFDPPAASQGIYRLTSDELIIVTSAKTRPKGFETAAAGANANNDESAVRFVLRRDNSLATERSVGENP